MRFDVVHDRGSHAAGTPPAEGFLSKLLWPQLLSPDLKRVPSVPLSAFTSFGRLRFVGIAVSGAHELPASWVAAWPQWFARHAGLSPPDDEKPKSQSSHTAAVIAAMLALAFIALASVDVHDYFVFT